MADRIIRDELLESERWLWLPNDTDRLCFIGLVLQVDDFGNMEGGANRLYRLLSTFTAVRSPETAMTIMGHLADADLVRRYEADGREFFHLPRLRSKRWYLARKCPPSPWCDAAAPLGKQERSQKNQGLKSERDTNVDTTLVQRDYNVAQGVGVGVGEKNTGAPRAAARPVVSLSDLVAEGVEKQHATDWLKARGKVPLTKTAWDAVKREAIAAHYTPAQAVKAAAENSWRGFKAAWVADKQPANDPFKGAR